MGIESILSFLLCFIYLINSVYCDDFQCPKRGKVGELKVPNVLSLIPKQTGYRANVEVINQYVNDLVHDYHDLQNKVSFIDYEATLQEGMNRRYIYHEKEEALLVISNECKRYDLIKSNEIILIKQWFEPQDIVDSSEIFKDLTHLGPTGLMVYANSISDKASYIGSELIEGRSVNHWFYCINPDGPYIDFYFDVATSMPYRFELYYPEWIEIEETTSTNETKTVKKQIDSATKYVFNFFIFKPLVISADDPIPYPLGYGCPAKYATPYNPLPDFSKANEFTMDMEAVITYADRDPIKSTARVMKRGDVISYEITEGTDFVRSIEMPPPLGRFQVNENNGRCNYYTSNYARDVTLVTRWPFHRDYGFNLLYYLVMKPTEDHAPTFISNIPLGNSVVQEYKAANFFSNRVDAIVDYYFINNASSSVPSKVIFTPSKSSYYYESTVTPTQVEVTIINYENGYFDYEDRFDVSGCFEKPGTFTWFQLLFSNPWMSEYNMVNIKESTEEYLSSFIPVTRIGEIHTQEVDSNIYVTVKLYDRPHLLNAYTPSNQYTISDPANILKRDKVEDCEQLCSATKDCYDFSYCDDYDCVIANDERYYATKVYKPGCTYYTRSSINVQSLIDKNFLSTMPQVLQQIRNRVSSSKFYLSMSGITAEDMFIVNGPEEIGDISQELHESGSSRPVRAEDFSMIETDRRFKEAQSKIEKSSLNDCFMACLNDDDCNTLSYCTDQNKECILSEETSSSLQDSFDDKTSHADGCNIYQKSFMDLFHEYPGRSLVLDAISIKTNVEITDCAKTCAQSTSFNCESFDYCVDGDYYKRNESSCFLHVNHIDIDKSQEINTTNWKFAEAGCTHYSKKSHLDYEHKVGFALKENMKQSIVGTFDHLSLEHCASKCNSAPDCFTLEFCDTIEYNQIADESFTLTSCSLTNLKPSKVDQPQVFEVSKSTNKICSIYINHKKITGKSETDPQPSKLVSSPTKSNTNFKLAIGLGTMVCILAFVAGFVGFKYSDNKGYIL